MTEGKYGMMNLEELTQDQMDEVNLAGFDRETGNTVLGREDNLKVLAASNTILALVLVGVLVLQAGQWYAERSDERERKKIVEEEMKAKKEATSPERSSSGVKRKESGRESKKAR